MATAATHAPRHVPPAGSSAVPDALSGAPGDEVSAAELEAREASVLASFERVFATFKRMASNYATLAILDARRAAVQFAWLVAGGIFVSVLLVTAWLAAVVALCVWLLDDVLTWPGVLAVAAALNIVGAVIVGMRLRAVFQHMPFEASLRQINSDGDKSNERKARQGAAA